MQVINYLTITYSEIKYNLLFQVDEYKKTIATNQQMIIEKFKLQLGF